MTVYEISYDLNAPGQDYESLHDAIESLGDSLHALESYWLVDADGESTKSIRGELKSHVDSGDQIVVTILQKTGGGRWAVHNARDVHEWLEERM